MIPRLNPQITHHRKMPFVGVNRRSVLKEICARLVCVQNDVMLPKCLKVKDVAINLSPLRILEPKI